MARKPRLHLPGALYHVMLRGNDKQRIFVTDADRYKFEELLADGVARYGHSIHAYCWMGNHIHMAVKVADTPLSKVIHNLSFRYTRYFNWRHTHVGHLFQGRYKCVLVDADSYLLQLVRYIHQNPIRAQICNELVNFAWSSHRAYLGHVKIPWLSTNWVLSQFADELDTATERYARFLSASSVSVRLAPS